MINIKDDTGVDLQFDWDGEESYSIFVLSDEPNPMVAFNKHEAEAIHRWLGETLGKLKPKVDIEGDSRWQKILEIQHSTNNDFLISLINTGNKWGKLTEKQLDKGQEAAMKELGE